MGILNTPSQPALPAAPKPLAKPPTPVQAKRDTQGSKKRKGYAALTSGGKSDPDNNLLGTATKP